jgi:hypothetical protein
MPAGNQTGWVYRRRVVCLIGAVGLGKILSLVVLLPESLSFAVHDGQANEFDAARLVAACDRMEMNRPIFDVVVHVSPGALLAAHGFNSAAPESGEEEGEGSAGDEKERRSAMRLPGLIAEGRLISLEDWLVRVTARP